jgi:hypothetical protein
LLVVSLASSWPALGAEAPLAMKDRRELFLDSAVL